MTIYDYLSTEFPRLQEMVDEMKAIQNDFSLLPEEYNNIKTTEIPCYIMTYNRNIENQTTYNYIKGHCKPIFVCSNDDPYLDTFIKSTDEEVIIFDKKDYIYSDFENGDNHGITPPYNKCGLFARRFIDDYTLKNNVGRYIVADNDLILLIKMCDRKTRKFEENLELIDFCIKLYFYLLEKYDFLLYVTASNNGVEMMGKFYKIGYYFAPASFNFHLSTRPVRWMSRIDDDTVTPFMLLKEEGKLALNLPIIIQRLLTSIGSGDMSPVYKALSEDLKDENIDGLEKVKDENERRKRIVISHYLNYYFKDATKRGLILRASIIRNILELRKRENLVKDIWKKLCEREQEIVQK